MRQFLRNYIDRIKGLDWVLMALAVTLTVVGIIELSSIAGGDRIDWWATAGRQIIFLVIGLLAIIGLFFFDVHSWQNETWLILLMYGGGLILLGGLLLFGGLIRGTKSWYQFGGFNFEPVEIVKVFLVLILAKYFSVRHIEMYRVRHVITSFLYTIIPVGLVLAQPDIGSGLLLLVIWLGVVIMSGIKLRHFLLLLFIAIVAALVTWSSLLAPYQKERLISFFDPGYDPQGIGYNSIQAKIAIGAGGWLGSGIGQGKQVQLGYLPEASTDFIFAALAEEWGLVGIVFVLAVFGLLFYRLLGHALRPHVDNFTRLTILGVSIILFSGFTLNAGMNLGLFPVTGTPLPFLSYGGSHLVSSFLALGLVLRLTANGR